MGLDISFVDGRVELKKLTLPSRYFYFEDQEYMKLLHVGEGFFPKDRVKTKISLINSNLILANESATKVYKSEGEFSVSSVEITLKSSNFEFINDELILHTNSKFIQLFKLKFDESSTFFYADILSKGRANEKFGFGALVVRNSFFEGEFLEYVERFNIDGEFLKSYLAKHKKEELMFAKVYIKAPLHVEEFLRIFKDESFAYTRGKKMIVGVLCGANVYELRMRVLEFHRVHRALFGRKEFDFAKA